MSANSELDGPRAASTDSFVVLVNSCDAFSDCWRPFFDLFAEQWTPPWPHILLNTEREVWVHGQVPVTCTAVQPGAERLTWSECLLRALGLVDTPLVLYMQEDYFIESRIRVDVLMHCVARMLADPSIAHIGLTEFGSQGPFERTSDEALWRISPRAKYRISLQAGLWRPASLGRYLRPHENSWMFELFGTRRAHRVQETFLTVSRDIYRRPHNSVLPYTHTGMVKGSWHPDVPALFAKHEIEVDYSRRGMYVPRRRWRTRLETLGALLSQPTAVLRSLRGEVDAIL